MKNVFYILQRMSFVQNYIDPGTGGAVFGSLGPILAALGAFLIAMIAVFRHYISFFLSLLWRHKKISALILLILLAVILVSGYFILHKGDTEMRYKKVLVVGIDGLDPDICRERMAAGKMPHLRLLVDQGTFADLSVVNPAQSPVSWSCLGCGVNPGKHGVFDFIHRDPKTYMPRLSVCHPTKHGGSKMKDDMKGTPFWEYTTEAGIPTTVIRWPVSLPPERISGGLLAGLGVPDICGLLNSYRYYTTQPDTWDRSKNIVNVSCTGKTFSTKITGPAKSIGKKAEIDFTGEIASGSDAITFHIQGKDITVKEGEFSPWVELQYSVGLLKKVSAICTIYVTHIPDEAGGLLEFYISSPELDPRNPAIQISEPGEYVTQLSEDIGIFHTLGIPEDINAAKAGHLPLDAFFTQCRDIDEERMKMAKDALAQWKEGVLAVVFDSSDRWQHIGWRGKEIAEEKAGPGKYVHEYYDVYADKIFALVESVIDDDTAVLMFSDHGFTSFERAFNMNNWLVEHGYMTLTEESTGDASVLFKNVDWSRTKAYSLGFSSIYINMRGREGKGIVALKDATAMKNEIITRLEAYTDEETGLKPVEKVYDSSQIYFGDYSEDAPDMVVGFIPGYRMGWQTAIGGLADSVCYWEKSEWKGDHLVDAHYVSGTFLTTFPVIDRAPRTIDIAPTILALCGCDIPSQMDGVSLYKKK